MLDSTTPLQILAAEKKLDEIIEFLDAL